MMGIVLRALDSAGLLAFFVHTAHTPPDEEDVAATAPSEVPIQIYNSPCVTATGVANPGEAPPIECSTCSIQSSTTLSFGRRYECKQ